MTIDAFDILSHGSMVLLFSSQDMANVVYIISGRRKSELEEWLGEVPRLVPLRALFQAFLQYVAYFHRGCVWNV